MNYPLIAQRVFNEPLLMHDGKLQVILHILSERIGFEFEVPNLGADLQGAGDIRSAPWRAAAQEGIGVIDVNGTLVNRWATAPSGATSYDQIRDRVQAAANDPKIKGILMRFDTYGGEVSGVWDTADVIREAGKVKPVWASIDDNAYSAGLALSSQASKIYITRSGGTGSAGVVAVHLDLSGKYEKEGVKPTTIYAGKLKTQFSSAAPLSEEATANLRALVDGEYDRFTKNVAEARRMSVAAVRGTEAGLFRGEEAIAIGFADHIGTFDQALSDLHAKVHGRVTTSGRSAAASQLKKGVVMEQQDNPTPAATAVPPVPVDLAAVTADATKAERSRIKAILTSEHAKGREPLAQHLAFMTSQSAEEANSALAVSSQTPAAPTGAEKIERANSSFRQAMAEVPNPKVGADASGDEASEAAITKSMVAYANMISGQKEETN